MFSVLADHHATIENAAAELFKTLVDRGYDPADIHADGEFIELGLAEVDETVVGIDGMPVLEYVDSPKLRERQKVMDILFPPEEDCDCDE